MLIIPTEKRFDWQRAPVMLLFIVSANCLLFFFYQSADNDKYYEALHRYANSGFFEVEWPQFEHYLESRGEHSALLTHRNALAGDNQGEVWVALLRDAGFYTFLQQRRDAFLTPAQLDKWVNERSQIHALIFSTSVLRFGLTPSELSITTLFSHQFLHGGFMHLLGNMFFLVICGFTVEAAIGPLRFLAFYLISGLAGGLLFYISNTSGSTPLVGASGAISGVMAMYVAAFRLKRIEFFYWFFMFVGFIRAPALLILGFYIGKEILDYYTNPHSNVAYMAHVGGFIAGSLLILGALLLNRNIFDFTYLEQDQSIDPAQEQLAEVYSLIEKYRFGLALKTLNALITEYGNSLERETLRYNLTKLRPGKAFLNSLHTLLRHKPGNERELALLHSVWRENPEIRHTLDTDSQVRLALNLTSPDYLTTAEDIFNALQRDKANHSALGVLARRLSLCFEGLGNAAKHKTYNDFAERAISGGSLR